MEILFVGLHVFGEIVNPFREDRDLDVRRTRVSFVCPELLNEFLLFSAVIDIVHSVSLNVQNANRTYCPSAVFRQRHQFAHCGRDNRFAFSKRRNAFEIGLLQ